MWPVRERLPDAGEESNFSLTTQTHSIPGYTLFKGSNSIKWLQGCEDWEGSASLSEEEVWRRLRV